MLEKSAQSEGAGAETGGGTLQDFSFSPHKQQGVLVGALGGGNAVTVIFKQVFYRKKNKNPPEISASNIHEILSVSTQKFEMQNEQRDLQNVLLFQ